MTIKGREVKRAIRDYNDSVSNLLEANSYTYSSRVKELIKLIDTNEVLSTIIGPFFEIEVNYNLIHGDGRTGWYELNIPIDENEQIAFVFQKMKESVEGEGFEIWDYAHRFFRHKRFDDNLYDWNNKVLIPVLRKIKNKLNDLIEDEIEGNEQEEVSQRKLQIINIHGNVSAEQGNVAIGHDIKQSLSQGDITKEFLREAINQGIVNKDQEEELTKITAQIDDELKKEQPSQLRLSNLADGLFNLGGRALLKLGHGMIDNVNWKAAASAIIVSLI